AHTTALLSHSCRRASTSSTGPRPDIRAHSASHRVSRAFSNARRALIASSCPTSAVLAVVEVVGTHVGLLQRLAHRAAGGSPVVGRGLLVVPADRLVGVVGLGPVLLGDGHVRRAPHVVGGSCAVTAGSQGAPGYPRRVG